jgi:molybdopterin/thiamine biosynthesis adenylyltransferase
MHQLSGQYEESIYWERVERSLAWIGTTEEQQRESQLRLRDATVGVAGCGGIGGALAVRLARLGVLHIKVADPDGFDWTNVNRQIGSARATLGHNKAEVVGKMVNELSGDVTVDVYPEGITTSNACEFVEGCDLVLDQMDFYVIPERYALHRAFRACERTKFIISAWCVGWGTSLFKYAKAEGMTIEERYGIPEDAELDAEVIEQLVWRFTPFVPRFPSEDVLRDLFIAKRKVPLFAGTPPVAEAACVQRAALVLTGLEREPYATVLPPAPACYWYDGSTFEGGIVNTAAPVEAAS